MCFNHGLWAKKGGSNVHIAVKSTKCLMAATPNRPCWVCWLWAVCCCCPGWFGLSSQIWAVLSSYELFSIKHAIQGLPSHRWQKPLTNLGLNHHLRFGWLDWVLVEFSMANRGYRSWKWRTRTWVKCRWNFAVPGWCRFAELLAYWLWWSICQEFFLKKTNRLQKLFVQY